MAVDFFMKLDKIPGESADHKHGGEIDVLAWSWGLSNSGSGHVGGGSGSGKASFQDLSFTKYIDKATTELMIAAAGGKHIPTALLTLRKAGEHPLEYLKVTMEDCLITSISTGGSGGEDRLTENVTLNFAKVKVEYCEQKKDGTGAAAQTFGWDIKANKKS